MQKNKETMGNKKGQSVIILTMKEDNRSYLFGSLSAIYGMFSSDDLGIAYTTLRNVVGSYMKSNDIKGDKPYSQVICERSKFTLHRAPLWLLERTGKDNGTNLQSKHE